jgi:NarL family two-component system response regulator YdfI
LTASTQPDSVKSKPDTVLTERELEVLEAASHGFRNKEIAYKLGITERTVKAHLTSVYQKFNVDSRAAAVAIATQRDLLKPASH